MATPNVSALPTLKLSCSCGTLFWKGVKAIMTSGCFCASLINALVAASNLAKLLLPSVNISLSSKPPERPKPGIAGGNKTKDLSS